MCLNEEGQLDPDLIQEGWNVPKAAAEAGSFVVVLEAEEDTIINFDALGY